MDRTSHTSLVYYHEIRNIIHLFVVFPVAFYCKREHEASLCLVG